MSVRAKFYVNSITHSKWGMEDAVLATVKLGPVTSGSKENKQFYAYSPAGQIELGTINEEVAKQFHIGEEFYVDFTPADKAKE